MNTSIFIIRSVHDVLEPRQRFAKKGKSDKIEEKERVMNQTQQTVQPTQPAAGKPKSNLAVIIIVIALGAIIVLGAGGYLAWKYYIKGKLTTTADQATNTNTGAKVSLKNLETIFAYPTGTQTKTDRTPGMNFKSEIGFTTADKLKTVYDYYINFASVQGLTVSQKTIEPDLTSAYMTIQGKGYYADIYIYQYEENTEFTITFYGDNIQNDTANTATTSSTPSSSNKTAISNEYVIADSNSRVITTAELTNFTPWQLKVARNEIYARHGREFVHQDLKCYFTTKSWYQASPTYSDSLLTSTDNKNIATILAYEQSINSPLLQTDSGC